MKVLSFILTLMLAGTQAEALLPPLYQSSREIRAILESEQLGQKLGSGDIILKIEKNNEGYEITTNKHQLQIDVNYEAAPYPGPAHYNLRFGEATPKK